MTVTPLPLPVPAGAGSVPAPMGPDAEASAETFAALVTQLLGGQGQQQATGLPVPDAVQPGVAQPEGVPATAVAEDPAVVVPGETEDETADGVDAGVGRRHRGDRAAAAADHGVPRRSPADRRRRAVP